MLKDRYEISVWEDYLIPAEGGFDDWASEHYEERKIAIIGSDSITAPCRAFEPKLVENINGTNTFTFKMVLNFRKNELENVITQFADANRKILQTSDALNLFYENLIFDGEVYQNPFLSLLTNERKIKVYWKNKWYDFIIKNCQEDSSGKTVIYTCKDLYINELSKNGFNIELDDKLQNNCGTAAELAQVVLEGTDWHVDVDGSDILQEESEEAVYRLTTIGDFFANNQKNNNSSTQFVAGTDVLLFYNQVQELITEVENNTTSTLPSDKRFGSMVLQFAYAESYVTEDNKLLVQDADSYIIPTVQYALFPDEKSIVFAINQQTILRLNTSTRPSTYRAIRIVRSQKTAFDPLTEKNCLVFRAVGKGKGFNSGDEIYHYTESEFIEPTVVNNLIVNANNFKDLSGWYGENLTFQLYPSLSNVIQNLDNYVAKSYLKLTQGYTYYNSGLKESSHLVSGGFQSGEEYCFRFLAKSSSGGSPSGDGYITRGIIVPKICQVGENQKPKPDTDYFSCEKNSDGSIRYTISQEKDPVTGKSLTWVECKMTCDKSATQSDIYTYNIGLFLIVNQNCWIENIQFFPIVFGSLYNSQGVLTNDLVRITPGQLDVSSVLNITYKYYNHTANSGLINVADLHYLYSKNNEDWNTTAIVPEYDDTYSKVRRISAKQSNRFNMLQSIAETFKCWCRFNIQHDYNGKTVYVNGVPQKTVTLVRDIGQETGIGFVYGIDLKSISRTVQSDQIVTKTIVLDNTNQFAPGGICTIKAARDNPSLEGFLLNFDYYISQGLLDWNTFNRDLYVPNSRANPDSIGYYYYLYRLNQQLDELNLSIVKREDELEKYKGYFTTYTSLLESAASDKLEVENYLIKVTNTNNLYAAMAYIQANGAIPEVQGKLLALSNNKAIIATYTQQVRQLKSIITNLYKNIKLKTGQRDDIQQQKEELDARFYKRYSRFIQEGSWKSDQYIDNNLYYLDAQSVAYTSSRPQVSYNISVVRLSSLEEYKNKVFRLGDITYIQDTEFFGYVYNNQIKTPYREKVLISEITSNFDTPEQDTFKVQNYKTQFEDLFQRITATTQSLQYASGEYARAAAAIEPDGTINPKTLQQSIALNTTLIHSSQNNSIIQNDGGITVTSLDNPLRKLQINSAGIFVTDADGNWINAVSAGGISTNLLTSGIINTSQITILDNGFQTFRWDSKGINAFDNLGEGYGVNLSKFVRFDHWGIYGMDSSDDTSGQDYVPASEEQIWEDAKFGMTWKGFFVKNNHGSHRVEVSSENDIQVVATPEGKNEQVRVKIGEINNNDFGLVIYDENGDAILQTNSEDGKLWLKKELNISHSNNNYHIEIGYLNTVDTTHGHQVINANNKFIVYEDGHITSISGRIGSADVSENGLVIHNGTFSIIDGDSREVLSFKNNSLSIKGNIEADTGQIGGWLIKEEGLYSLAGAQEEAGSYNTDDSYIKLIGQNSDRQGYIEAEYLKIGQGAEILHYLNLTPSPAIWESDHNYEVGNYCQYIPDSEALSYRCIEAHTSAVSFDESKWELIENESVMILNPLEYQGLVFKAKEIKLYQSGVLSFGNITINGPQSTISGINWSISPDFASFKNVNVSGKITTTVFEKNRVQSVGGSMVFKPSYKIKSISKDQDNRTAIVLDVEQEGEGTTTGEDLVQADGWVVLVNSNGEKTEPKKVFSYDADTLTVKLSGNDSVEGSFNHLIYLGLEGDIVIGVNSWNNGGYKEKDFLLSRGLSITEVGISDDTPYFVPRLFIGDLGAQNLSLDGFKSLEGYGLYSSNVYLQGSLVTKLTVDSEASDWQEGTDYKVNDTCKYNNQSYFCIVEHNSGSSFVSSNWEEYNVFAGISTTNNIAATKFDTSDGSNIVFWAGARGLEEEAIRNAPFQVTKNGSIYAQRGLFEGAIITRSEIRGADIYTARIHGDGDDPGLIFYNAEKSIEFHGKNLNEPDKLVFGIGINGFYNSNGFFVNLGQGTPVFTGEYNTDAGDKNSLEIKNNFINGTSVAIKDGDNETANFTYDETDLNSSLTKINNTIIFGSVDEGLKYQKDSQGYNLYVF